MTKCSIEHDVEQFEDDPLEFIRLDLSLPLAAAGSASFSSTGGGDGTTRRQAAADVVKALVSSGYESQATEIVLNWVQLGLQVIGKCYFWTSSFRSLQEYQKNASENWKYKSSAIYLTSAVAARGTTLQVRCVPLLQYFYAN
jgi:exportin-2 (importin alpha re-exporter)